MTNVYMLFFAAHSIPFVNKLPLFTKAIIPTT